MSENVVMINLLPDIKQTALRTLEVGLKAKYGDQIETITKKWPLRDKIVTKKRILTQGIRVDRYDMHSWLQMAKEGESIKETSLSVVRDCGTAKRILFCAHGHLDCTEYCYTAKGEQLANVIQLAYFIANIIPRVKGKIFNIELVICHAARTKRYTDEQQSLSDPIQAKTSFAYKVFREIHRLGLNNFTLTARTGAVSFGTFQNGLVTEGDEYAVLHSAKIKLENSYYKKMALLYRTEVTQRFGSAKIESLKAIIVPPGCKDLSTSIYKFKPLDKDEEWLRKAYFYQARVKDLSAKLKEFETKYRKVHGSEHVKYGSGAISKGYGAFEYSIKAGRLAITNLFNDEITYLTP